MADNSKLEHIEPFLKGRAEIWFQALQFTNQPLSWNDFYNKLLQRFGNKRELLFQFVVSEEEGQKEVTEADGSNVGKEFYSSTSFNSSLSETLKPEGAKSITSHHLEELVHDDEFSRIKTGVDCLIDEELLPRADDNDVSLENLVDDFKTDDNLLNPTTCDLYDDDGSLPVGEDFTTLDEINDNDRTDDRDHFLEILAGDSENENAASPVLLTEYVEFYHKVDRMSMKDQKGLLGLSSNGSYKLEGIADGESFEEDSLIDALLCFINVKVRINSKVRGCKLHYEMFDEEVSFNLLSVNMFGRPYSSFLTTYSEKEIGKKTFHETNKHWEPWLVKATSFKGGSSKIMKVNKQSSDTAMEETLRKALGREKVLVKFPLQAFGIIRGLLCW
ncbi:OLC1v1030326C1 [Oldenlandia corymbosa var. corymbosa]|uniref:OLC1v1030326C1 n=1 Tax=Oldenlandia corymbosa var. corymbosa TaxID=529605 RepID=A0AAV1CGU0_OLDCO|nr:OLC1v1030326C1 [Oldenlandia corymbosa var. corymbosa]